MEKERRKKELNDKEMARVARNMEQLEEGLYLTGLAFCKSKIDSSFGLKGIKIEAQDGPSINQHLH